MDYKTIRRMLLGTALLTASTAGAQQFASELQLSTDDAVYWYRICNAAGGMQDYVMTDCNAESDDKVLQTLVELLKTETTNEKSQWKLTAGEDGKIVLTNRATGRQLGSESIDVGDHNVTQLVFSGAQGFSVTSLGNDAFKLESIEDDGVNRCLALAEGNTEALAYPTENESSSVIGWKFTLTETILTGVEAAGYVRPVIRVANKRISVSGCSEWQLFNAQGEEMPRTTALATGVYVVKTPKEVVKVVVP